jgi:hypothetical protein
MLEGVSLDTLKPPDFNLQFSVFSFSYELLEDDDTGVEN